MSRNPNGIILYLRNKKKFIFDYLYLLMPSLLDNSFYKPADCNLYNYECNCHDVLLIICDHSYSIIIIICSLIVIY